MSIETAIITSAKQDKNFHIRLRAAVEKRLREYGIVDHGIFPKEVSGIASKEWDFLMSLDGITLDYLQGGIMQAIPSQRYTCTCDPKKVQELKDTYVFERQNVVQLPAWSNARKIRLKNGHPPDISIDSCIVEAIHYLWERGIETTGCCCGHNQMRAWVSVDQEDYIAMHELGYEQVPVMISEEGYAMGIYTFYL